MSHKEILADLGALTAQLELVTSEMEETPELVEEALLTMRGMCQIQLQVIEAELAGRTA